MNNENKPSVIAELTAALASMAERAAAAEAEAEQYKKSSDEWYQFFANKDKELRDTKAELQKARLYRKGEDAGYSQQSINEWILKKYGQQDPHNLTRAQYDEACAAMDNAKQQGGQDNA